MFESDAQARLQVAREHADTPARDCRCAQRANDRRRFPLHWPERLQARARHLVKRLAAAVALLGAVAAVAAPGAGAGASANGAGATCSTLSRGVPCRLANVLANGPFAIGASGRLLTGLHAYVVSPSTIDRDSTRHSPIFCCRPVSTQ
jgi:hypothetical protein